MENRLDLKQFILIVAVLGMLASVIGGGAWIIWKAITGLSPQTATAIVAGVATVLVSVFSVLWSKRADRLREIEQEHRKQKLPIYEEFLSLLFKIVMSDKAGVERILFAIRRDVGHKNKGLKTGDLLTIFINDVDSFLLSKPDDRVIP